MSLECQEGRERSARMKQLHLQFDFFQALQKVLGRAPSGIMRAKILRQWLDVQID